MILNLLRSIQERLLWFAAAFLASILLFCTGLCLILRKRLLFLFLLNCRANGLLRLTYRSFNYAALARLALHGASAKCLLHEHMLASRPFRTSLSCATSDSILEPGSDYSDPLTTAAS